MGKRTVASSWRQYEKLARAWLAEEKPRAEVLAELEELTEKVNRDQIGDHALAPLFVRPYIMAPLSLEYTMQMAEDGDVPKWLTAFDADSQQVLLHPLAITLWIHEIREIDLNVSDEDEDLLRLRYRSFLHEIGKLPSIYLLFLVVLQRVAYLLEIAHLEKRGGVVEVAEGEAYHTLLWAFKELESFAQRSNGIDVRSRFGMSWYEADWITGR